MSGKALIDNSAYSISGGKTRTNGTNYNISMGSTYIDGTNKKIEFREIFTITAGSVGFDKDTFLNISGAHYTPTNLFGAYFTFTVKPNEKIYIGAYAGVFTPKSVNVNGKTSQIIDGQFVEIPVTSNLNIIFQDTTWTVT